MGIVFKVAEITLLGFFYRVIPKGVVALEASVCLARSDWAVDSQPARAARVLTPADFSRMRRGAQLTSRLSGMKREAVESPVPSNQSTNQQ